jgi:D-lactate dehydrogenase (cytochrome)
MKYKTEAIDRYLRDESNTPGKNISGVYIPDNDAEIAELLEGDGPFTIYAGGTGITAGATADGGAVISTENLKFLHVDGSLNQVIAGAGVTLQELGAELARHGLWYPVDSTEQTATIGGNAATNASGARSFKYGSIRNFVNALHVIIPGAGRFRISRNSSMAKGLELPCRIMSSNCGEFILPGSGGNNIRFIDTASGMPRKNNAGYYMKENMDVIDLLIGSEGTLGIITMIELEVMKMPHEITAFMAYFDDESRLFDMIERIKKADTGYKPCSMEYLDRESIKLLRSHGKEIKRSGGAVFMEVESGSEKETFEIYDFMDSVFSDAGIGPGDITVSSTKEKKNYIYEIREAVPNIVNEMIRTRKLRKVSTDFAVKDGRFREMMALYENIRQKAGIKSVMFGHIGDNNLHINFIPENETEYFKAKEICNDAAKKIADMGGTVAAEHGVGKLKKGYLKYMFDPEVFEAMRKIKTAFDPGNKLNMGNIF